MVGDREMKNNIIDLGSGGTWTKSALNQILNKNGYELKDIREQPIEEKLMTREEAANKIKDRVYDIEFANIDYLLIAKLEALGLIKLKEENKRFELYNPARDEIVETDDKNDVYNWLLDGFKIVKDNG